MIPDNEGIGWILNNGMVNLKGHASMGSQNNPLDEHLRGWTYWGSTVDF